MASAAASGRLYSRCSCAHASEQALFVGGRTPALPPVACLAQNSLLVPCSGQHPSRPRRHRIANRSAGRLFPAGTQAAQKTSGAGGHWGQHGVVHGAGRRHGLYGGGRGGNGAEHRGDTAHAVRCAASCAAARLPVWHGECCACVVPWTSAGLLGQGELRCPCLPACWRVAVAASWVVHCNRAGPSGCRA